MDPKPRPKFPLDEARKVSEALQLADAQRLQADDKEHIIIEEDDDAMEEEEVEHLQFEDTVGSISSSRTQ